MKYKIRLEGSISPLFEGEAKTVYAGDGIAIAWLGILGTKDYEIMVLTLVDCSENRTVKVDLDILGDLWLVKSTR